MKKIIIFIIIVIVIVSGIYYIYVNYRAQYNSALKINKDYEQYLNREIYGSELATIINKTIDSNETNKIQKNNKGIYLNNDLNSINIEIKMKDDNNTIYQAEKIYNGGIQKFINYYGNIKFKCTRIDYHKATQKVKYMLFEQVDE